MHGRASWILLESHTGEELAVVFQHILDEFNIDDKVSLLQKVREVCLSLHRSCLLPVTMHLIIL